MVRQASSAEALAKSVIRRTSSGRESPRAMARSTPRRNLSWRMWASAASAWAAATASISVTRSATRRVVGMSSPSSRSVRTSSRRAREVSS